MRAKVNCGWRRRLPARVFTAFADPEHRLTLTEQGAYLDDFDDPSQRENGTGGLLDALGAYLAQTPRAPERRCRYAPLTEARSGGG